MAAIYLDPECAAQVGFSNTNQNLINGFPFNILLSPKKQVNLHLFIFKLNKNSITDTEFQISIRMFSKDQILKALATDNSSG